MRTFAVIAAALALLASCASHAQTPDLPHAADAGWKGQKVCEPLFENDQVSAARCTFPPGVGHERHFHRAHWGYIVQGSTMRTTDQNGTIERDLASGSSWWSDGVAWHEALNVGDKVAIYIIIEPKQGRNPQ